MKSTNTTIDRIIDFLKRRKTALIVSLCNVVVLLLLSYFLNNQALFTGEDLNQYAWMEWVKDKCGITKNKVEKDKALFVNVAYDKQLIDRHDEYGMTLGNVDITDRAKLHSFLKILQQTDTYKYVFMDIRFEKGYDSQEDSALFAQIKAMRNIVVANHSDIEVIDSSLLAKMALNDYSITITGTNFKRYEYLRNGQKSVPLYAYHELTGNSINRHLFLYISNHKLCYNSLFITFPIEDWSEFDEQQNKVYYNLGSDLLENYSETDIGILTNGKYVIIGDMVEDMHDTYSGAKPGSVITYYAFLALMNGEHYVSYALLVFLGLLYFIISMSLFENKSIIEKIPFVKKSRSKAVHFCASLLKYSLLLLIAMIILNILFGISTSIILPSIYFAIQKTYINYKRHKI